jgi:hypothetical protein
MDVLGPSKHISLEKKGLYFIGRSDFAGFFDSEGRFIKPIKFLCYRSLLNCLRLTTSLNRIDIQSAIFPIIFTLVLVGQFGMFGEREAA